MQLTNDGLQKEWKKLKSDQMLGKERGSKYKLTSEDPIRKTSTTAYYRGIWRYRTGNNQHNYERIIVKQYFTDQQIDSNSQPKSSGSYVNPEEEFLNDHGELLSQNNLSIFIEILSIKDKKYLIMKGYSSTLSSFAAKGYEKFSKSQEELNIFCIRMCDILTCFNDGLFSNYRSRDKSQPVCLIHQSITPQNIVKFDLQKDGYYLIDYSNAVVGLKPEDSKYHYGGNINPLYQAPQSFHQQGYNSKVDIWSFGCILYEILSGNYKFITSLENFQKQKMPTYVNKQLKMLQMKLSKREEKSMKNPRKWLQIVEKCLKIKHQQRLNITKLRELVLQKPQFWKQDRRDIKSPWLEESNIFQAIRLSTISDKISELFQELYLSEQDCLIDYRWLIYGFIKSVCMKFIQKYYSFKHSLKQLSKGQIDQERVNHISIDHNRILSILKESKITDKIKKYLKTFKNTQKYSSSIEAEIKRYFPDIEVADENEDINIFDSILIGQKLMGTNAYQIMLEITYFTSDYHIKIFDLTTSKEVAEVEFMKIARNCEEFCRRIQDKLKANPSHLKRQFSLFPSIETNKKLTRLNIISKSS